MVNQDISGGFYTVDGGSGAELLTLLVYMGDFVKERHERMSITDHRFAEVTARVVFATDPFGAGPAAPSPVRTAGSELMAPANRGLITAQGQRVIPIASLEASQGTAIYVTGESGQMVTRFPEIGADRLIGSGLVVFAANALAPTQLPSTLEEYLRTLPLDRSMTGSDPLVRLNEVLTEIQSRLEPDAFIGLFNGMFLPALRMVLQTRFLLVVVDDDRPYRSFVYEFIRPLGKVKRRQQPWATTLWHRILRYILRSGSTTLSMDLGNLAECKRYSIEVEAPFDSWFVEGYVEGPDRSGDHPVPEPVNVEQRSRLFYEARRKGTAPAVLRCRLNAVGTGVVRNSVFASWFVLATVLAGAIGVSVTQSHTLLSTQIGTGASLLLLFPGLVASVLSAPAKHTLTAQLQFPIRLTLWALGVLTFVLAGMTAARASGVTSLTMWWVATGLSGFATAVLTYRDHRLREPR